MSVWICVEKDILEELETVLLFDEQEGICIGYYFSDCLCFIRELDGKNLYHVTHFQPLPEIPVKKLY